MRVIRVLTYLLLVCALSFPWPTQAQDTADSLANQARAAYQQKEYERSAQLYIAAIKQGIQSANQIYDAACSLALAGKREEAFDYLTQSINRGYANLDNLKKDTDLVTLHADARWAVLVVKCEANQKLQKALWDNPAWNITYRETLSEDEKVAGLSKFWSEAKYNFANFDLVPALDWDGLYLTYLPKVRQAKSTLEYYRTLMELCAQLKDAHTNINPPNELTDEIFARPLLRTRLIEGRVLVVQIFDDGLQQQGLKPGLEVLEVNGMPVKQYAEQRVLPYQSSSTKQDQEVRGYEYALLSGSTKEPVELTLRARDGHTFKQSLSRVSAQERAKRVPPRQPTEFKLLPGNIGYVALTTFNDERVVKQFEEAFAEIEKTDALILDIRDNGGGNSNNGYRILQYLTDKPFKTSLWKTRNYRPAFRAWVGGDEWHIGTVGEWQPKGTKFYTKPVVVLTSPRTFSAAEDFAVAFDYLKRGKLIGEATGGSTGQPLFFKLPGGGSARVCSKRDTYPDGKEFVGVGVQPNLVVRPTVADLRAGRDTVLEAALSELSKQARAIR